MARARSAPCSAAATRSSAESLVHTSRHPLILHKITQMRKASNTPKYLNQLMKEVSTLLCYEATASMSIEQQPVTTRVGDEMGQRIAGVG